MFIPKIRRKGNPHSRIHKCPKCGTPLLASTITRNKGDFCRKCGEFIDVSRDRENYTGFQFQNME